MTKWKGPILAKGLWLNERRAKWAVHYFGLTAEQRLTIHDRKGRRKKRQSMMRDVKEDTGAGALKLVLGRLFWTKLLCRRKVVHSSPINKASSKTETGHIKNNTSIVNGPTRDRDIPKTSQLRKLMVSEFQCCRKGFTKLKYEMKTRRPDKDVSYLAEHCVTFIKEKRFCQLKEEIKREMERRRLDTELERMEALAAGLLEKCTICLSVDCLPTDMVSCQAGHRFCRRCVVTTAEGVLATGRWVVRCLGKYDIEMEVDQLQRVLQPIIQSKLMVNRHAKEQIAAGLANLVSCPYCPYQYITDKLEECSWDYCKICKLDNHIPFSFKEYKEELLDVSRRKVQDEHTMSWVMIFYKCGYSDGDGPVQGDDPVQGGDRVQVDRCVQGEDPVQCDGHLISVSSVLGEKDPSLLNVWGMLISQLAVVNLSIGETSSKCSQISAELKYCRISLLKALIDICKQRGFHRKSGWILKEQVGLKGGMPNIQSEKDFTFANESSNSEDDFTFANTTSGELSDDGETPNENKLSNPLPSILYPIVDSRALTFPQLNLPLVEYTWHVSGYD